MLRHVLFLLMLILFFALQYRLWEGYGNLPDLWALKKDVAVQALKIKELQQRNQALANEINALKNDPNAVEAQARRRLGMIKKGETFYQIIEGPWPEPLNKRP